MFERTRRPPVTVAPPVSVARHPANAPTLDHWAHPEAPDHELTAWGSRAMPERFSDIPVHAPGREPTGITGLPTARPSLPLQPKVDVGPVDDPLEKEADRVADLVLGISVHSSRVAASRASAVGGDVLQKPGAGSVPTTEAPAIVHDVVASAGEPLDADTRQALEPRFGFDFSRVRVHHDAQAAESAQSIRAQAFTVGTDIAFAEGRYDPKSATGQRLLAHELAHVVQQGRADALTVQREPVSGATNQLATAATPASASPPARGHQGDTASLAEVMAAVEHVRPSGTAGRYVTELHGRAIEMDESQRAALAATATQSLRDAAEGVRRKADAARSAYETQNQVNEASPVSAFVVTSIAGVRGMSAEILEASRAAESLAAQATSAAGTGALTRAAQLLSLAETQAARAAQLERQYREGIISAGEGTVTALEFTRDASFVTLGVLAIIATGGAAAGAGTTMTAFGASVATVSTANAIAIGAPAVAAGGGALMQLALGDRIDWGRVGVDVAVGIILARFGGRFSQTLFTRMVGSGAVAGVGKLAFGRIVSSLVTHEAATLFATVVDAAYRESLGDNVTWEQFVDRLADRMSDPKGLFVAVLLGAVQAGAEAELGGSRLTEITDSRGKPVGETDVIRAGKIREDKSALGLHSINPRTGKPAPDSDERSWAERQIFKKTVNRINNLATADATRPAAGGSRVHPSIDELRTVREYEVVIDGDSPVLRAEVEAALGRLRLAFPRWKFTAKFGQGG